MKAWDSYLEHTKGRGSSYDAYRRTKAAADRAEYEARLAAAKAEIAENAGKGAGGLLLLGQELLELMPVELRQEFTAFLEAQSIQVEIDDDGWGGADEDEVKQASPSVSKG